MTAKELRLKFLKFFEKRGHKVIPSASLVPSEKVELAGTQRVLFTTAGMHPLIPYLLGESHPHGKRLTNVQKSLRTDDIDEVGDAWHNTFFEMLGNWSLGDYWKKEAIEWSYEFLTKELSVPHEKIWVTVFAGDPSSSLDEARDKGRGQVPKDDESIKIWKSLNIPDERIVELGREDNWWGPVGQTGPCGPDTEMFVDTSGKPHGSTKLTTSGKDCLPGDNCGRFSEVWNDVFMEYNKTKEGKYEPLKQKNVDTGMGVERTTAILQGKDNVYDTELFSPIMKIIKENTSTYEEKSARIVADHLRAAVFLMADGVVPKNIDQGYILRRLIRRSISQIGAMGGKSNLTDQILNEYISSYSQVYPDLKRSREKIIAGVEEEQKKFRKSLEVAKEEFNKMTTVGRNVRFRDHGDLAFYLFETYGLPIEIFLEEINNTGILNDPVAIRKKFDEKMVKHQEVSRAGSKQKFAGGLADTSEITVRGHTATHLLHQALRDVLGSSVYQTGSNITPERIRFDFSHGEKLTEEQIKKVEEIVNKKIKENLKVTKTMMTKEEADKKDAIGLFREKYGDEVSIYQIEDPSQSLRQVYSIEYCGGPHVDSTAKVGDFKIVKEKALGVGQRRIRAVIS